MHTRLYNTLLAISLAVFTATAVLAGPIRGVSANIQPKNDKGEIVDAELPDPFSEFTLIEEQLLQDEQLTDIPGRLVALVTSPEGKDFIIVYGQSVLADGASTPEIKVGEFVYDSYLVDTKFSANLGVPSFTGEASSEYKLEYRFYRGASCLVPTRQVDRALFSLYCKEAHAAIAARGLKLREFRVIGSCATIHSAYAFIKGTKASADVSGLGWKVGGSFYSAKQMTKNKVKIGVNLIPFIADPKIYIAPAIENPERGFGGKELEKIDSRDALLPASAFPNVFRIRANGM